MKYGLGSVTGEIRSSVGIGSRAHVSIVLDGRSDWRSTFREQKVKRKSQESGKSIATDQKIFT